MGDIKVVISMASLGYKFQIRCGCGRECQAIVDRQGARKSGALSVGDAWWLTMATNGSNSPSRLYQDETVSDLWQYLRQNFKRGPPSL
jgi:hypothetical protein